VNCKKEFQKKRPLQATCSIPCAIARGKYLDQKKKDDEARKDRVRRSEELYGLKKFPDLEQDLQKLCNEIARRIDKGMTCISCGAHNPKDGGHYLAVKGHEIIRFNLHQIRLQCYTCNRHLEGNTIPYLQALKKIHGDKYAEYLTTGMMIRYRELRTDRVMITDAIKIARKERNKLRKSDLTYTATERIALRREINNKLGIYL